MDLPTLFSIFIRDITLTRPMRDDLIKGHKTLRERLSQDERLWVRLFHDALDGRNFDHLTRLSLGRFGRSGLGITPPA
jgi:hypothetical protein